MTREQFIKDYNSMTNKQLAEKYQVSEMTIYRKAKKLQLKKSREKLKF